MTKQTVQIAYNPVTGKLLNANDDVRYIVSSVLSYEVEGYEHMESHKYHGWDGRSTFYTYANDTFPAGFVGVVERRLRKEGYRVQRVARPLPAPLGVEEPKVDSFGFDPKYDYQMNTVEALLKHGAMIARVATGGGKSRIAKLATARIDRPTLFITTRKVLMHQMQRGFEASNMPCGIIGDGIYEPNPKLNVAMVQTLASRLRMPSDDDESATAIRQRRIVEETKELLSKVQFVIGEEAHEAGGDEYFKVLQACRAASYRLALTGTPFMRADAEANMRLMAVFGQIGIDVTEEMLIERGILARPVFKFAHQAAPLKLRNGTSWQRATELGIIEAGDRNQQIIDNALEAASYGLPVMILVQRKKHGEVLKKELTKAGLATKYIFGESKQKQRDQALKELGSGEIQVLIGSTILDVGVDVPAVGMVILAGGGKAEVAHRQRIGRGLRSKSSGPNVCLILDFHDEHNKYLRKHALSRQQIIKDTPGFRENILKRGAHFDYEALGFTKI